MKKLYKVVIENSLEFELFQSIVLSLGFSWYKNSNIFCLHQAELVDGYAVLTDNVKFPMMLMCDNYNQIIFILKHNLEDDKVKFSDFIELVENGQIFIS